MGWVTTPIKASLFLYLREASWSAAVGRYFAFHYVAAAAAVCAHEELAAHWIPLLFLHDACLQLLPG
jgi:hypothetical protein